MIFRMIMSNLNCSVPFKKRWSPYGEDQENPCNVASANDDSYWYLGKTECYRANAAYSLYGILHGEEDKGCTKRTFINSFFTNEGIEGFTTALEQTGYFSFSVSENGNQNNGNQNNKGNNYPAGMSSQCYNGGNNDGNNNGRSYGLACSGKNFVSKKFKGSYCDVNHEVGVTDNNEEFNMQLANAECIPIFSSSTYDGNEDSSLKLLQYSRACSVNQFPEQCPDPYGKLKAYQRTMNHASEKANDPRREKLRNGFSWILLAVGILLLLAAFSLYLEQKREQSRHRRTSKSQERGRSAKIENTSDKKDTRRQRNVQSRSRSQESQRGGWWRRVRRSFGRK